MTAIPENIGHEHITQAINEIDSNGIPKIRKSKTHFVIHNGKKYPPKYIISLANKFINGKELKSESFHTLRHAVPFLKKKGFDVVIL
jgi:hypothetical protein